MKVAVICAADTGVEYYRQKWPARAVADITGWDVRIYGPREVEIADHGRSFFVRGLDMESLDLVVLSRTGQEKQVRFIREMQRIGVAVIIDVDDDLSALHPQSSSYRLWNGGFGGRNRVHHRTLKDACDTADLVTVTTRALERKYGHHGRVERLRNYLPYQADPIPAKDGDLFTILWSGAVTSHRGDLEVMGDAIRQMVDGGTRAHLRIVGSKKDVAKILRIPELAVSDTGYIPVEKWHEVLAEEAAAADVGIVPLALTPFNQAKSWLKGMEYLGASLPVIASPTEPYRSLAVDSSYVTLADDPAAWLDALEVSALRKEVQGRPSLHRGVADEFDASRGAYVLPEGVSGWVDAWQRAVDRRKNLKVVRPTGRVTRSGNAPRRKKR
jgi:glycosyltransferase involved in cell wall biosynthesis